MSIAVDSLLLLVCLLLSIKCGMITTQVRSLQTRYALLHEWSRSFCDRVTDHQTLINRLVNQVEQQNSEHITYAEPELAKPVFDYSVADKTDFDAVEALLNRVMAEAKGRV